MGFLKDLFEKKLRSGQVEDLSVQVSSQSAYCLPALQSSPGFLSQPAATGSATEPQEALGPSGRAEDTVCYLRAQPSTKSFSYAQVKRKHVEQAERVQAQLAALHVTPGNAPPPEVVSRYASIQQFSQKVELYRGSISTVYKGVCILSNKKVIIKAYRKCKMHPKHHHKLEREIACMWALTGPYAAQLYATFEDAAAIYLIMEYCEGGDLFKTMLMHGGVLDEQWVCVEVITPLLRILEKMHSLKLLHRDIKPENIFLSGIGKFKLGDFGLAIKIDEELPFSRSGTLDYMAPEVLKNPSVPFQESAAVDLGMLSSRGVKPYGPPVDVWAAGVLAYELVCGRPPFEVEDEAQTAALIMYSDAITFASNRTQLWADFVRAALVKQPEHRPTASHLLQHPWIQTNLQNTMAEHYRPSKELLLQPLPVDAAARYTLSAKRTMSLSGASGGALSLPGITLPPMSPSRVAANLERAKLEAFGDAASREEHAVATSKLAPQPARNEALQLQEMPMELPLEAKRPPPLSGLDATTAHAAPSTTADTSYTSQRLPPNPLVRKGLPPAFSPLKVTLPTEPQVEPGANPYDSLSGFCYSPTTPVAKPGIKERMKFYFQRQGGL